jgi:lycopene cyclase domain-containing protein
VPEGLVDDTRGQGRGEGGREGGLAGALAAEETEARGAVDSHHPTPPVPRLDLDPREDDRVARFSYVAILAFVMVGCLWLEVALRTRVLRRWRRLALAILPVVVVFYAWDAYAVAAEHWAFDAERILGIHLPGSVPLDEILFFIAIPIASILTLEAVRSVKPQYRVGDEVEGDPP